MARTDTPPRLPASDAGWQLQLLGQPSLVCTDDGRTLVLRPKDAALLAIVALSAPVKADHLAALLWPGATARQADNSLRQRLFRLRRDTAAPLVANSAQWQLDARVTTDIEPTLAAILDDENAGRDELLGDLEFDDSPDLADWLRAERRKWRERRNDALAAAATACEKAGAVARGLVYAQRLIDADPFAEHAWRHLMRLHYLRGDRSAAIAAFERLERRLKDELGTRPSAETIELMATIEEAGASLPAQRAVVPASLLRPPRLIGREGELRRLAGAWSARRVFLLVGEAGIGKSRLLHDFAAGRAGAVVVQARPGDAGIAYALLARLVRAMLGATGLELAAARTRELALILPELGAPVAVGGQAQRLLLQRSVEITLADAARAGLQALIVDDLHFADDASVEFLQSMLDADTLAALRWGFAQRPADAGEAASALRTALEEGGRVETVTLQPLDLEQLRALIESLAVAELDPARLAPALLKHSGGNPMFALETLKDLVISEHGAAADTGLELPQPVSVGALVARRLAQLSAPALRLARTAALAGVDFHAELAAAVLETHPLDIAEPWRELEAAQVIRDQGFAHDLILEATLASVPQPIAQLLHRRIAAYLEDHQAAPERLAPHWAGAGEWQRAGERYAASAARARRASQRSHEIEYWRLAADAFDRGGGRERAFDARCETIHALIVVQGVTQAQAAIDALLAAAATDAERAAALTAKATAALMAADAATGIAAAAQALELTRESASPWPRFQAARLHAVGLAQAGRTAEALAVIEPYRSLIEAEGTPEQRGNFWADYAYVLNSVRRLRDTGFALQQAIENASALGDIAELATLTSNLATVKGNLGQSAEALALAERALALQAQLGATDGPEGAVLETYVGLYNGHLGRYGQALRHLDNAIACFERDKQPVWTALASNHKAQLLIDLGQFARAQQALAYETPNIDHIRARGVAVAARLARALGQPGGERIDEAVALLEGGGDPHVRMHALLDRAGWHDGGVDLERYDEVLRMALQLEFAGVAMKARLLRAQAQSRAGERAQAAQAMREIVGQMPALQPVDLYFGEAWWIAAQVFDANDDRDDALMALAQGARWVRQVALPNVPEPFRDSFLQRNPSNRALLAAADAKLGR
ncbi:MAG: AAA family ATPase [Burkholderiaceae bacterium]|nr:AAA family ATPase [Burkholderiaceae bacterium]